MRSLLARPAWVILLSALWGLARYLDGFLLIFLRQETGMALAPALSRNFRLAECGLEVIYALGLGLGLWLLVLLVLFFLPRKPTDQPVAVATRCLLPLLVPVGLTAVAAASLFASPRFPYGLNLALTLAYEGAFKEFLTLGLIALSVFAALKQALVKREPVELVELSGPAPARHGKIGRLAPIGLAAATTAAFAFLTPSWLWQDGAGQGNTPKYLRMAAALAGSGSLDIERADSGRGASPLTFLARLPHMGRRAMAEARTLAAALIGSARQGKLYLGGNRAREANRAMLRGVDGGIYYINAPGPGLLILPAYLVDRTLNRALRAERQIAVMLFWNLLAALLLLEMARAASALEGQVAAGWAAAFLLGFAPPVLLYTHHVYPELPASLALLYAFRRLLMDPAPSLGGVASAATALALLPWLHQKFALTAGVMGLAAAGRLIRMNALWRLPRLVLLAVPLVLSAFAVMVYNHALTGSIAPDATFSAVGRTAFAPQNLLSGLLGLLVDVENGILVFAPVYLLVLAGAPCFFGRHARIAALLCLVAGSYLLVIASFPYWPGAISAVARYMLGVAPLMALPLALVLKRGRSDGIVAGVGASLFAATTAISVSFFADPITAYEPHLLLGRILFSDPYQYLPSFLREPDIGPDPVLVYKMAVLVAAAVLLVFGLGNRVARDCPPGLQDSSDYWRHLVLGAALIVGLTLAAAAFLERLPENPTEKKRPEFLDSRSEGGLEVAVDGEYRFESGGVWVPGRGGTRFLIRSRQGLARLRLQIANGPRPNEAKLVLPGQGASTVALNPSERREVALPLGRAYRFEGPGGREWIYRLEVRSKEGFVPRAEGTDAQDDRFLGCFLVFLPP